MKKIIFKTNIFLLVGLFFLVNQVSAKEKIGFFFNENLQEILAQERFLTFDGEKVPFELANFSSQHGFLIYDGNYFSEIENSRYCPDQIGLLAVCDLTDSINAWGSYKKGSVLFIYEDKLIEFLKNMAEKKSQKAENARFRMTENGLVLLQESHRGYEMNVIGSQMQIMNALKNNPQQNEIPLLMNYVEPEISTNDLSSLKIEDKMAEGKSSFAGSPENRIHNIQVAVNRFDGLVLQPQEELSFVEILGPVEEETGYKEELVIKKNETVPEFGGGVCQVSTTLFRAALNAGLKITERHNHAYPVGYYSPQGTDATIYIPSPDLKFINNTPGRLLIQAKLEGTQLTFEFYGLDDGREVEIEGPKVTERTEDGKMRTVLSQIVKDEKGNEISRNTFKSFYDNPANYHPPEFTEKPDDWSSKQWKAYKREHGL